MQINQYHGSYNRSRRGVAIKYINIHYTGGTGSARNNCVYFSGGNRNASADYFVDDSGIWEYNDPASGYYTWAVGDGRGRYGITNSNSINIEVVNNGGAFSAQEIAYLCELVPYLMNKFGVSADHVMRHYDASRKHCPEYYVDNGRWNELRQKITNGQAPAVSTSSSAPASSGGGSGSSSSSGGSGIAAVQKWCNDNYNYNQVVDGINGKNTKKGLVKALQTELNRQCGAGLAVDGIWGTKTCAACINVKQGARGNITKVLQGALICRGYNTNGFDGIFGSGTTNAVKALQRACGLSADGIAGKNTFAALLR